MVSNVKVRELLKFFKTKNFDYTKYDGPSQHIIDDIPTLEMVKRKLLIGA